jgi:ABC-type nitrate/sulfonate/bicarbonate transport system substrate-binding protein
MRAAAGPGRSAGSSTRFEQRKREDRLLKSVATACVALLSIFAAASADAQKMSVRSSYVPAVPGLAAWVAQEKGFFAGRDLDVSFIALQNVSLVPGSVGKQIDIGMVTIVDLIKAVSAGLKVAAVTGGHLEVEGSTTNMLVARKDSGIKTIKDIAGRRVAAPSLGAILHVALLHWMMKEGMDINSIRTVEVPFPNMGDMMAAGNVDVALGAQPFADRMIATGNIPLGNPVLQVASPALATVWIADRAWAEQNNAALAKWSAALRQAKDFIANNPQEAREVLAKYTKLPPPVVATLPLPDFETGLQASQIEVWIKVLAELKQLQSPVDAAHLLAMAQ